MSFLISPSSLNKVFHVPMEERRRDLHKPFGGESTQAQIVRDVMSKTNCHIEICEARDHSLSIMVTGKAEGVILARKEILKKLQTQVCAVCMLCVWCVCACVRVCMCVHVCTCTLSGFVFLENLCMSVVNTSLPCLYHARCVGSS